MKTQRYEVSDLIELARRSPTGRLATRYRELAWIGLTIPNVLLIMTIDWTLGIHILSNEPKYGYSSLVYSDGKIFLSFLIVAGIAAWSWKLFLPFITASRNAASYHDSIFDFFGFEVAEKDVDHFERRSYRILSDFVLVRTDSSEIVGSESLVRGFPVW